MRAVLLVVCGVFAACSQPPKPSPFTGFYKNYWNCRDQYAEIDAKVDAAGVRDAQFYRVPGYPYLRTDRLLATFGPHVRGVNDVSEWVRRMRELDQDSREFEFANLGMSDFDAATMRDRFLNCGRILANIELTEPGALDAMIEKVYPTDAYSNFARIVGLHALRIPRIHAREAAIRHELTSSQLRHPDGLYAAALEWTVKPVEDTGLLLGIADTIQFNILGFPNLFGSQWRALAERHAPRMWTESPNDLEGPAAPQWTTSGLDADPTRPVVSYQIGYTRFADELLVQITYSIWFRSLAGSRSTPIDGLVWRVTLDRRLEPLVYESMHPSGGDHRWYPVRPLALRDGTTAPESFVSPELVPVDELALHLEPGSHRLLQVGSTPAAATRAERHFELRPYEELFTMPLPSGGTRSLFGPDGLVSGSSGSDDVAGWSSGIIRPRALRQSGHQAIGRINRRHFDDPDLMDATFLPPPADAPPVRTARSP